MFLTSLTHEERADVGLSSSGSLWTRKIKEFSFKTTHSLQILHSSAQISLSCLDMCSWSPPPVGSSVSVSWFCQVRVPCGY